MQNKSHLEAAKLELRWGPTDCWRIVLNLVCMSPTYFEIVQGMHPGAGRPWHLDEETLRSLLFPFWGERVEAGRAAKMANYIETRTVDAQGRMFPRTLIQLVQYAIEEEQMCIRDSKYSYPSALALVRGCSLELQDLRWALPSWIDAKQLLIPSVLDSRRLSTRG